MSISGKLLSSILVVCVISVLGLAMFASAMAKSIGRDEHMYCTAGVLLGQGQMIYRDFSYIAQLPYQPLLYAVAYKALRTDYYLLVGRVISVICDVVILLCIIGIYRRVLGKLSGVGALLGLVGGIVYVFNPIVDYANGFAWNNDLVAMCVVLSFWLIALANPKEPLEYWRIALIGVLLSLATFMRMTTVVVQCIFLVVILWKGAGTTNGRIKAALVFLGVTAAVGIWPVYTFACAPKAFLINVFQIHLLNSELLHEIRMTFNKPQLLFRCLTTYGYLALMVTAICFWGLAGWVRRRITEEQSTCFALSIGLVMVFFGIALILPETWEQHLAMPVPFVIISLAYPLRYVSQIERRKYFAAGRSMLLLCAAVAVVSHPLVLLRIPLVFCRENWVPIRLHKISVDITKRSGTSGRILTLTPLLALEGGGQIYREFSAGPFAYRVSGRMSAEQLTVSHTAGSKELTRLIHTSPPAAVIVGWEWESLDESLVRAAVQPGWQREVYADTGVVGYFPP